MDVDHLWIVVDKSRKFFKIEYQGERRKFERRNTGRNPVSAPDQRIRKRKDVSQIQCFRCDKFGHYAMNCPERKRQHATFANDEPPQKKLKESSDDEFEFW